MIVMIMMLISSIHDLTHKNNLFVPAGLIFLLLFTAGIARNEESFIPQFGDATAKAALPFVYETGSDEKDYILQVNGAGLALFDYDNDGDLDIFMVNGSKLELKPGETPPSDKLFRNDGNWKFVDVTKEAGVGDGLWGCGCAVADIDNDGDPDLYVSNWGPDRLFRNNGNGTFTDIAEKAGINEPEWGASCAFGDYDRDGFVDLYVTNYLEFDLKKVPKRGERASCVLVGKIPVHCGPGGLTPVADSLYHNNGNGTFTNVSEPSGIRKVENSFGLGVFYMDYDRDGWPDIYVANDRFPNLLFHNKKDGTFEEAGLEAGVSLGGMGDVLSGMGIDCGDLNGDNLEDIVVCNYAQQPNTFYKNEDNGFFTESSKEAGLYYETFHFLAWGVLMIDADYDGDLDLFYSNGHVMPQIDQTNPIQGYKETNQLFLNDGKGHFTDVSAKAGEVFKVKLSSRGCAYGDLDGDGDQDIVAGNMDNPPTIYENLGVSGNHWIGVRLIGVMCNRDALGSWVTVKTAEREITRYHHGVFSYASQSEMTLRFGLGKQTQIEPITVRWPNGSQETFSAEGVDKIVTLKQGSGKALALSLSLKEDRQ